MALITVITVLSVSVISLGLLDIDYSGNYKTSSNNCLFLLKQELS